MKQLLFLILATTLTISTNGQMIDGRIRKEIEILKKGGIDTFLVYSLYCNGGMPTLDTCAYEQPKYLVWVQHKSYYIRKLDYCRSYKPILLDTINPLSFYLTYKNQIDKEEIKRPAYVSSRNSKNEIIMTSTVSHDCFHKMTFQIRKVTIAKSISDYNLTFKTFDDGKKNMHYDYNRKTKLTAIITQISKLVEQLDMQNEYEPQ